MEEKKRIFVYFVDLCNRDFVKLKNDVGEEIKNNKIGTFNQKLLDDIERTILSLSKDTHFGINIPKDRIPKYYILNYEVRNLWKSNLIKAWRLIYTIKGDDIEIYVAVLEFFDHKNYNKRFGYRD